MQGTFFICRSILWLASWIAPAGERNQFRQSVTRHVWHWCRFLAESRRFDREQKLELARFCWRAFPAAFWLRFDHDQFLRRWERTRRSPSACLIAIAVVLLLVVAIGGVVPTARSLLTSSIRDPDRVSVISLNGKFRRVRSQTLLELASAWKTSKMLDAVAPYSWGPDQLAVPGRTIPILAARVAPEFFQVLDLRAATGRTLRAGDEQNCGDCVVLSNEIWQLQFGADPAVVGRQITLDGSPRTVIGVVPRNFHLLSPEIAVWGLLDSRLPPFSNFVERIGAVARMRPGVTVHQLDLNLADLTENAGYVFPASMLTVTSGRAEIRRYFVSYCFFALIAVACAGLIVYLRSGAALGRAPLTLRDRLRWWSFFAAKSFLLLTLMGLMAWSAVRVVSIFLYGSVHPMANGVALWVFLGISVAPLSWAIYDQQRRCRVCLSRLGTPIQIGAPGHVLLDWSGTEMVCPQGHGVLYLPDSQANWLERDRWNNLDQSWADLFRDS